MRSTFFGLEIGRKALQAQQRALDVTGHNIANANTEGYTRQRAVMETPTPFTYPSFNRLYGAGQLGTGVMVQEIKRVRDDFLDLQIRKENATTGEWASRKNSLEKLEVIINEPSNSGLRTVLDQFWESLQTLTTRPEDRSVRSAVRQRGMAVAETFNHMDQQLVDLQMDIDASIRIKVGEINNIATQIAALNEQIVKVEVSGDNANDLRDKRDLLVDQLSSLIKVDAKEDPYGALTVTIGGRALVSDQLVNTLTTVSVPPNGFAEVQWAADGAVVAPSSGSVQGLIYSRDTIAANQRSQLNDLATRFITLFSGQHLLGYGLDSNTDVSAYIPGAVGVNAQLTAANAPGTFDFTNPQKLIVAVDGGAPQIINLNANYGGLAALIAAIDGPLTGATAADDGFGNIRITSATTGTTSSVVIAGPAATTLGFGRLFFTGTDATEMKVDAIIDDLDHIAAATGPPVMGLISPGDNGNALKLATLKHNTTAMGTSSFDDYYRSMVAELGVDSQAAQRMVDNQQLLLGQINSQKQQVSGVSLDEEMTNMIKFQHAYNAAARVVTSMDEMLDTIINRLGTVGR